MAEVTNMKTVAARLRRMAREPKAEAGSAADPATTAIKPATKAQTKSSLVLELLARLQGATLDQLVEATGWLPHTTRAAMTGLKKKGHILNSAKVEGGPRIYSVVQGLTPPAGSSDGEPAESAS